MSNVKLSNVNLNSLLLHFFSRCAISNNMEDLKLKRDCHCHLEGSIFPRTFDGIFNVMREKGIGLPFSQPPYYRVPSGFKEFLIEFRRAYPLFKTPETYAIVLDEMLNVMNEGGIDHAEIHINLALLKTFNHNPFRLFDRLWRVRNQWKEQVDCRFMVDVPWQFSPNLFNPFIDESKFFQDRGVIGLSLGGDEKMAEPDVFKYTLEDGADAGYQVLAHCGELEVNYKIREVLKYLPVTRLIHATSATKSTELLKSIRQRNIKVDVCFTSNYRLCGIDYKDHPWRKFVEQGIDINFGSDDPAIFHTTPGKELALARELTGDK